jgi:catechol 2,3-dioxygenase-like lactoylglutathione lyase family enzyme
MEEAIPVLRVSDASRALAWFTRLGYNQEWEHTFEPGLPVFTSIARQGGGARLFLSEHTGDASPDTLIHLRVDDIDAVAHEFGVDVAEKPWGREVHLVDPDGNRLRVGVSATS